jgi:prophage regulatory protein
MSDKQAKKILPLPETGLLRLGAFIGHGKPIPVAPSTWWAGVKSGRFPKPVKLGPKITAWQAADIHALIKNGVMTGRSADASRNNE